MNPETVFQFTWICFLGFITCTFGAFHIINDENQNGVEIVGNFTTASITECIMLCN